MGLAGLGVGGDKQGKQREDDDAFDHEGMGFIPSCAIPSLTGSSRRNILRAMPPIADRRKRIKELAFRAFAYGSRLRGLVQFGKLQSPPEAVLDELVFA
jgi:hypothetical protein